MRPPYSSPLTARIAFSRKLFFLPAEMALLICILVMPNCMLVIHFGLTSAAPSTTT